MALQQLTLPGLQATPHHPPTWTQAVNEYLAACGGAAHSVEAFKRDLKVLAELFPGRDPTTLTMNEARWAVRTISQRVKAATAARRHGTWRAFYAWLVERGQMTNSPFRFGFADMTPRRYRPPDYLSHEQGEALLAAAKADPRADFLIRLVLYTGMKSSEVARLRVQDMDALGNVVTVHGRRDRAVPVPADLFPAYDAFVEAALDGERPAPGDKAVPFSTRWMQLRVAEVAGQVEGDLGFAPTFSILRWTRAVWDLRNGVPGDRVRVKLGYSEKSWELHAQRLLEPLVPHPLEGQMLSLN